MALLCILSTIIVIGIRQLFNQNALAAGGRTFERRFLSSIARRFLRTFIGRFEFCCGCRCCHRFAFCCGCNFWDGRRFERSFLRNIGRRFVRKFVCWFAFRCGCNFRDGRRFGCRVGCRWCSVLWKSCISGLQCGLQ